MTREITIQSDKRAPPGKGWKHQGSETELGDIEAGEAHKGKEASVSESSHYEKNPHISEWEIADDDPKKGVAL